MVKPTHATESPRAQSNLQTVATTSTVVASASVRADSSQNPAVSFTSPSEAAQDVPSQQTDSAEDHWVPKVEYHWGGTPVQGCSSLSGGRLSRDWLRYIHFDGSAYYYDARHRIITIADVTNEKSYRLYENALIKINDRISKVAHYNSHVQTLVMKDVENPVSSSTFIMDYREGLFIAPFSEKVDGIIDAEYKTPNFWAAIREFPMHLRDLPVNIELDFLGALSFGATERILEWTETTFPFTDEQSRRLVQVYRDLKNDLDRGTPVIPALCSHIASAMVKVETARRAANFGTPEFKLYRDVVPDESGWKVKLADISLGIILFGAHRMYRVRLQSVRVKGVIYLEDFRELLRNFLAEWSDSNLLATVFVGANIAFLAVPNITGIQRTASLASTVFAILSVAMGVYHIWQHRTRLDASSDDAYHYMGQYQSTKGAEHDADLVVTACFLSIPLVALLYAVLCFAVALGAFCVQSTDVHGRILLVVILGITCSAGLSTLVFFWHAWRGPRTKEVSEDDITDIMEYGWRKKTSRILAEGKRVLHKPLRRPPRNTQ